MHEVLHITECFGGGVATAINDYVHNTPEFRHHLVYRPRGLKGPLPSQENGFQETWQFGASPLQAIKVIRKAAREYPDAIIHVHSSWAGLATRMLLSSRRRTIIYTPHGFSFERQDIGSLPRQVFRTVERILAGNTTTIAGCSPREVALANSLGAITNFLPNAIPKREPAWRNRVGQGIDIVMIGRLSAAKDPEFFVELADNLRSLGQNANLTWVGEGEERFLRSLQKAGIEVTGWCKPEDVRQHILKNSIYVHTSKWEGFPITVLEAVSEGIPVFVRNIPAFENFESLPKFTTAADLADAVSRLCAEDATELAAAQRKEVLSVFSTEAQRRSLLELYGESYERSNFVP